MAKDDSKSLERPARLAPGMASTVESPLAPSRSVSSVSGNTFSQSALRHTSESAQASSTKVIENGLSSNAASIDQPKSLVKPSTKERLRKIAIARAASKNLASKSSVIAPTVSENYHAEVLSTATPSLPKLSPSSSSSLSAPAASEPLRPSEPSTPARPSASSASTGSFASPATRSATSSAAVSPTSSATVSPTSSPTVPPTSSATVTPASSPTVPPTSSATRATAPNRWLSTLCNVCIHLTIFIAVFFAVNYALRPISQLRSRTAKAITAAAAAAQGQPAAVAQGQPAAVAQGQPAAVAQGQPAAVAQGQPAAAAAGHAQRAAGGKAPTPAAGQAQSGKQGQPLTPRTAVGTVFVGPDGRARRRIRFVPPPDNASKKVARKRAVM